MSWASLYRVLNLIVPIAISCDPLQELCCQWQQLRQCGRVPFRWFTSRKRTMTSQGARLVPPCLTNWSLSQYKRPNVRQNWITNKTHGSLIVSQQWKIPENESLRHCPTVKPFGNLNAWSQWQTEMLACFSLFQSDQFPLTVSKLVV